MNSDRWERIQDAFHEALEHPAKARPALLDKLLGDDPDLRAEVDSLLATYETEPSFLEDSPVRLEETGEPPATPVPSRTGTTIGPWTVAERIGEGGMGTVWRAERSGDDFEQQAALKIVKRGMDSEHVVARFRAERRILASLDHPDIARLYDGGITGDGLPYFVMELIEGGTPIDRHCLANDLPLRDRLVLFTRVCSAVHYAHQNLVVHRDLKPSNILISRAGDVKLLDFGIAKLLDTDAGTHESPMTRTDMRLLTPEYTSPEQFRGEPVTTAADVYSLGLLLYEMLTGHKGHALSKRSLTEMARVVCEDDPPRPSARAGTDDGAKSGAIPGARLRGDLDNIVMKAIRKEPSDRYASAKALADDVGRYLDHEPITARPQTVRYQFGKFVRRHRFGSLAAGLSLLLVIGFGAAMAVQSARIAKQAREIALERDKAQEIATFLQDLFAVAAPTQSRGETVTARELLDRGSERLSGELENDPPLQSSMMRVVGEVYTNLALFPQAESLLTRAQAIAEGGGWPGADAGRAAALHSLAKLRFMETKPLESDSLFALAVGEAERVWGRRHVETARIFEDYATLKSELGELDRADSLHREALGIIEAAFGRRSVETAEVLSNLAGNLRLLDRLDEAQTIESEAYAIRRETFGEPHTAVAASITNLAWIARARGEYAEAESLARAALAQNEVLYPENHPNVANAMTNLAGILQQNQKWDEAVAMYTDCREMVREVYGEESAQYVRHLNNLATLYIRQQQFEKADTTYRDLLPLLDRHLGETHPVTTSVRANYSQVLAGFGDYMGAARILQDVLEIEIERYGEEHSEVASTMSTLSTFYMDHGDLASALPIAKRALAIRRAILPEGHPDLANSLINVGYACGNGDEGEAYYDEAVRVLRDAYGDDDIRTVRGETSLARYHLRRGQWAEAESILARGVVIADRENEPDNWLNQWIYECLAQAYREQGNETLARSYEAKVIDG